MFNNRLILCPTDFSPGSAKVFDFACNLAGLSESQVCVLHVTPPVVSYGDVAASLKDGFRDDLCEQLRA